MKQFPLICAFLILCLGSQCVSTTPAPRTLADFNQGTPEQMLTRKEHEQRFFELAQNAAFRENNNNLRRAKEAFEQGHLSAEGVASCLRIDPHISSHLESEMTRHYTMYDMVDGTILQVYACVGREGNAPPTPKQKEQIRVLVDKAIEKHGYCQWMVDLGGLDPEFAKYQVGAESGHPVSAYLFLKAVGKSMN